MHSLFIIMTMYETKEAMTEKDTCYENISDL